jgi:hypothetical protein
MTEPAENKPKTKRENKPKTKREQLAQREAERDAKREAFEEARASQRLDDLDALDALILEHGEVDVDICVLDVSLPVGMPTMIVAKCPGDYEVKQYRHTVKDRKDGRNRVIEGDAAAGAELIADTCVVYPKGDTLEKLYAARPGVKQQIGVLAVNLTCGRKEATGKE